MQLPLRGIITPLATPLSLSNPAEPSLDVPGLERLIEHVLSGGVRDACLAPCAVRHCWAAGGAPRSRQPCPYREVNGRVPVLAGISDTAISETFRVADTALEAGADALVLAATPAISSTCRTIWRYSESVTQTDLPSVFNIPSSDKNFLRSRDRSAPLIFWRCSD